MKLLLCLAPALSAVFAAPAAASNPARDITRTGAVVLDRTGVHASGNVRADHRFRVGSVTKTFVPATVLQLAGEGRLSLDDPIDRWVPGAGAIPLVVEQVTGRPLAADLARFYRALQTGRVLAPAQLAVVVVLSNRQPLGKRQDAAVNRALDAAHCS